MDKNFDRFSVHAPLRCSRVLLTLLHHVFRPIFDLFLNFLIFEDDFFLFEMGFVYVGFFSVQHSRVAKLFISF